MAFLVRSNVAATQHLTAQKGCEHTLVEMHTRTIGSGGNLFVMSAYCRPSSRDLDFDETVGQAKQLAGNRPLLVLGDLNAPHTTWGYKFQSKRGKALAKTMEDLELALLNEPGAATRRGTGTNGDTVPDLLWLAGTLDATWRNEDVRLGSDHDILSVTIRGPKFRAEIGTVRITDWDRICKCGAEAAESSTEAQESSGRPYAEWAREQKAALDKFTETVATTAKTPFVDAKARAHRRNTKLPKRIASLNKQISEYAAKLCRENWMSTCNGLQGMLSARKTWCLLRHLVDPLNGRAATNRNLTKVLNAYGGDGKRLIEDLKAKYLKTECGQFPLPEEYGAPENPELDEPFTTTELLTAIDKSNKKSALGTDAITYRLLNNVSDAATAELLDHINLAWERSELPTEWKEAEVVERMVLQRLQGLLDETNQMPATMYGFPQHLCTQDVVRQLNELVFKKATRHSPRGILALNLKGAFNNVSHGSVLENLRKTGCGRRTYGYVENFLTKRTATIRIGEERSDPIELGDRGTPQGSALSPLLFNLPSCPCQAGSEAWVEETLQRAATTVHEYATTCGLSCAPQKSELLMVQPGRPKKEPPPNVIVTIDGPKIKLTQQVRILGLLLRDDGKATAATHKIKNVSEQISSMIRRLTRADREALDTVVRKATKLALGVPVHSSTEKLLGMRRHNSVDEMVEAHLSNQRIRLSQT
ncbi:uncharacterized protein LOC144166431 [Haemaphysalis longicornis]